MKEQTRHVKDHTRMERHGIFYSLTAVLLITAILFLATLTRQPQSSLSMAPDEIQRATSIMHTLERDAQRAHEIISTRAFLSILAHITNTTQPVENVTAAYREAYVNGTVNGTPAALMQDTTLPDWLARMNTTLAAQHATLTASMQNLTLSQDDPWHVTLNATLTYTLRLAHVTYTRTLPLTTRVSIIGLEDPFYTIHSRGRIPNLIIPAETRDIHQLINASYNNSLYIPSPLAPSFLQRLEDNTSPSRMGIESIANGELFILNGFPQYDGRSSIDYEYFTNPTVGACANNTPAWFRINPTHTSLYENLTLIPCS